MARRKTRRGWERTFYWLAALAVLPAAVFTLAAGGLHGPLGLAGWLAGLAQGLLCVPIAFELRRRADARLERAGKAAAARRRATTKTKASATKGS